MKKWLPVALWMMAILYFSTMRISKGSGELLPSLAHFTEYAILGFLIWRAIELAWNCGYQPSATYAIVSATAYGIMMEIVQLFLPYRSFSIVDIAVNLAGATAAVLSLRLLGLHVISRNT
ncbi:MAG: VanZ family protein [Firmicutes bacterium]|nr:VanZ family protein [Bacillota bacterium]